MHVSNPYLNNWKILSPGGGGCTGFPMSNPFDPGMAVTACDMTGAYMTYDYGLSWRQVNMPGRTFCAQFDYFDENTVYFGSNGLFKSTDKGMSWDLIFPDPSKMVGIELQGDEAKLDVRAKDTWPGGAVTGIALDPQNPLEMHVGVVYHKLAADKIPEGAGENGYLTVYSSYDGGKNFVQGHSLKWVYVCRMYIDPTSPKDNRTLYVITDYDAVRIEGGVATRILPQGVSQIFDAGFGIFPTTGKPAVFMVTGGGHQNGVYHSGVWRSLDGGSSWKQLSSNLDVDMGQLNPDQTRKYRNIGVYEKDASHVYVSCWRWPGVICEEPYPPENYTGILKSTDGGEHFDWCMRIGRSYPENSEGGWVAKDFDCDWGSGSMGLLINQGNPNVVYQSGQGIWCTTDAGKTWNMRHTMTLPDGSATTRGVDVTTNYGVHFDPFDRNKMAISFTDISLQISDNGGKGWRTRNKQQGVPHSWENTCYWLVYDPKVQGKTWSVWASSHDLPRDKMFMDKMYAKYPGGICISTDDFKTLKPLIGCGIPENCNPTHIVLDESSPVGNRTLYAALMGHGVYKSVDDGNTWFPVNHGLGSNLNAWRLLLQPDGRLYLLVFSGINVREEEADDELDIMGRRISKIVEAKPVDGSIYTSVDGGASWQEIPMPKGTHSPGDLIIDPTNENIAYLSCWPQTHTRTTPPCGGLYKTTDGMKTWQLLTKETEYVYAAEIHPDNANIVYYSNFDGKVMRSEDGGATFVRLAGYAFKWAHRPMIDPYNHDMIYITTFGGGVWYGPAHITQE